MQYTSPSNFNSNNDLLLFYGWWQIAVCLFAFVSLLAIWHHIGKRQGDTGQIWLALSILSWSFSGIAEVIFALLSTSQQNQILLEGYRSIFSLLNSLFILLGLPWFRYLPPLLKPIIKSNYWLFIVGLPFLFSFLPTINRMFLINQPKFINELDVYYSILTLIFLGYVLWESFAQRRLKIMAWLSVICILTTFIAQAFKLTDSETNLILFSTIFKTTLIMLFFALALSWVKELSENMIPPANGIGISFNSTKEDDKIIYHVVLSGIKGKGKPIKLSPAMFELFSTFAIKKVNGNEWLEIKPRKDPRPHLAYEINDHNEIKRLVIALAEGLFGKGNWTKDLHEIPLKNSLFEISEKRERKIRLAVPAENIDFPEKQSNFS